MFFCDNVLNYHGSDDDYYAEWAEEVQEDGGWIALLNVRLHVEQEMHDSRLHHYLKFGEDYNDLLWRSQKPQVVFSLVEVMVSGKVRRLAG